MMVAGIPKKPISRRLEQSKAEQWSAGWVDRLSQVGLHPRFSGCSRVRFGAHVDDGHRAVRRDADDLTDLPCLGNDLDVQRFGFDHYLSQCLFEQRNINAAADLYVFANIVRWT